MKFNINDEVTVVDIYSRNFGKSGLVKSRMTSPGSIRYYVDLAGPVPEIFYESDLEHKNPLVWGALPPTSLQSAIKAVSFNEGDEVVITDFGDMYCGQRAVIKTVDPADNSYLLEFDIFGSRETKWYFRDSHFEHVKRPSNTRSAPGVCWNPQYIDDKWFTGKVFRYCKKCGKTPDEH